MQTIGFQEQHADKINITYKKRVAHSRAMRYAIKGTHILSFTLCTIPMKHAYMVVLRLQYLLYLINFKISIMKLVVITSTFQLSSSMKHSSIQPKPSVIRYAAPMGKHFLSSAFNKKTITRSNKSKRRVL